MAPGPSAFARSLAFLLRTTIVSLPSHTMQKRIYDAKVWLPKQFVDVQNERIGRRMAY